MPNPKPQAPNPQPHTPNHKPQTPTQVLNPNPKTKPQTPNLKPQTLTQVLALPFFIFFLPESPHWLLINDKVLPLTLRISE